MAANQKLGYQDYQHLYSFCVAAELKTNSNVVVYEQTFLTTDYIYGDIMKISRITRQMNRHVCVLIHEQSKKGLRPGKNHRQGRFLLVSQTIKVNPTQF